MPVSPSSLPVGVTVRSNGDVVFCDVYNHRVRVISASNGQISTLAGTGNAAFGGDGQSAVAAYLYEPLAIAAYPNGDILIADTKNNRIRVVSFTTGVINTVAGGNAAYQSNGYSGDGELATGAWIASPTGVALFDNGDFVVVESSNNRIRFVSAASGVITSIVIDVFGLQVVATYANGNVLFSQGSSISVWNAATGDISLLFGSVQTYTYFASWSGVNETYTYAVFHNPLGLTVLPNDDVLVADCSNFNNVVRLVTSSGIVSTLIGTSSWQTFNNDGLRGNDTLINCPSGVAVSPDGSIIFIDAGNQRVRMLTPPTLPLSTTPLPTPSTTPTPACAASLYRSLPRTDLVGTLTGNAWSPASAFMAPSESSCLQACCDAPSCDAYTFASNDLMFSIAKGLSQSAACFLYTNVTALVPSSGYASGALLSAYS